MSQPRVCAVQFLNTAPLVWGMLYGDQKDQFQLQTGLPSECADRLESGAADIGVLPCVEVERLGLSVIPGTGIACRGAVRSILLISKVPPDRIRTLAADTSSRTSVQLARVILARRYGAEPKLSPCPPDLDRMLAANDAALIIGDPALRIEPALLPYQVLDLGEEWDQLTGLPMVFAVWGCRPGFDPQALAPAFSASCAYGMAHLDEIVAREAAPRGLSEQLARDYLTRNVVLEFGPREEEGMRVFLDYVRDSARLVSAGNETA